MGYLAVWLTLAFTLLSRVTRLGPGQGFGTGLTILAYALISLPVFVALPISLVLRRIARREMLVFFPAFGIGLVVALATLLGATYCPVALLDYVPPWWLWLFAHTPPTEARSIAYFPLTLIGALAPIPCLFLRHPRILRRHLRIGYLALTALYLLLTVFGLEPWNMFRYFGSA